MTLEIPPLDRRIEDLQYYIDKYFKEFCRKYNKYLVITEGTIQKLFGELYPYVGEAGGGEKVVVYKTEEAVKISELLKKHRGNRKLAAQELGISTTTLWRKMNKYGIESKFGAD